MEVSATDHRIPLSADWQLVRTAANAIANPAELLSQVLAWQSACVPGTVAQIMLKDAAQPIDLDADDWWYRCHFTSSSAEHDTPS